MSEPLTLLFAWAAGVLLGLVFFGALWWTVRRGVSSRRPALWFVASLLLRVGVVLAGFLLVSGRHWQRLLASLLGFVIARLVLTRLAGPPSEPHDTLAKGAGHAS